MNDDLCHCGITWIAFIISIGINIAVTNCFVQFLSFQEADE